RSGPSCRLFQRQRPRCKSPGRRQIAWPSKIRTFRQALAMNTSRAVDRYPLRPSHDSRPADGPARTRSMPLRRSTRKLHLGPWERPEPPSGNPWLGENFNRPAAGVLPSGWLQWTSAAGAGVAVAAASGVGATGGLTIAATISQAAAHAWYNLPAAADVEVSAAVYLNSLIPAQVLARGANLGPANSTHYAPALTPPPHPPLLPPVHPPTP